MFIILAVSLSGRVNGCWRCWSPMVAGAVGLQLNPCKSFSSGLTETCTCVLKQFAKFYDHSRARKNPRTPKTEKLLRNKPTPFVFLP